MTWYEYPYNYSNGTLVNGTADFITYTNTIFNDWLATAIILMIWLATFGISLVAGSKKALMTASFISFVFSIYFIRSNLISPVITVGLLILTIVGALFSANEGGY